MIGLKKATVGGGDDVTIHSHDFAYYNQVFLSPSSLLYGGVCAKDTGPQLALGLWAYILERGFVPTENPRDGLPG
jgi:hypothetical protein